MEKVKRFILMNKLFLGSILLVLFFAWTDSLQLEMIYKLVDPEKWQLYSAHLQPTIWILWAGIIAAIAYLYFLFTRDKSEAIALAAAPAIMMFFGLEDFLYGMLKPKLMEGCMPWFSSYPPWNIIQSLFQIPCINMTVLFVTSMIGIFVAWCVFRYLREKY